jgi:uncharacterized protein
MLTADLVDARKKDGELLLRPLDAAAREEAHAIAAAYLDLARAHVGKRREEVEEAWAAYEPHRPKLAAGLRKLVSDACTFEAEARVDPAVVRRDTFTRASAARRSGTFDRDVVLAESAAALGLDVDAMDRALFADLRDEHLLVAAPTENAATLVEAWELGQAQAVLLTAVRIACEVPRASPGLVRAFFGKLKFHRLLFHAERVGEGFRLVVDGPYSMFDSVTKYGLQFACILPALRSLERWTLVADIRWGKARERLIFRMQGPDRAKALADDEVHLSDDARELATAIDALGKGWRAEPANVVLEVPGEGVCVPDLVLLHRKRRVYVEILGFWSRDAVFKRVELAARGLGAPVIFAVSSRLRVSAEVLDDALPASLYVYKGKMSPRAVVAHAARLLDV